MPIENSLSTDESNEADLLIPDMLAGMIKPIAALISDDVTKAAATALRDDVAQFTCDLNDISPHQECVRSGGEIANLCNTYQTSISEDEYAERQHKSYAETVYSAAVTAWREALQKWSEPMSALSLQPKPISQRFCSVK
ncbi:hypothetical protein QWY75_09145 [Pontixanthobacter aestiaquae]|uniref:Uncharacterized protein n=1 Tax=Pontixanthobacter aestiaquae TaxID=1509367 RepID=A0A844Z4J8_9SPHN|nr:hypothetical protein [Pontixanthobacter aestiaquae]MDN3646363.1 hypothetical protein [Pontixanthobacter aestiaquae]MXO82648.1 hypothetical protein [Pontixanthobacter aestiaquae]